jgi:hypothetical protein
MAVLTEDEILGALKQCYDPEIPVNIVDLGLIYGVRFEPAGDQQDVAIDMTLTAQGVRNTSTLAHTSRIASNNCRACEMPTSISCGHHRGPLNASALTPASNSVSSSPRYTFQIHPADLALEYQRAL